MLANVLKPHGRKESDHLVLRFTGEADAVRLWIRGFARETVTSAWKQLEETEAHRQRGTPGGLVGGLALSAAGYEALGLVGEAFGPAGRVFRDGMKRRAFALLGLVLVDDPFATEEDSFGSYLVFRKLQQDVDGFNAGVSALASTLAVDE